MNLAQLDIKARGGLSLWTFVCVDCYYNNMLPCTKRLAKSTKQFILGLTRHDSVLGQASSASIMPTRLNRMETNFKGKQHQALESLCRKVPTYQVPRAAYRSC